MELRITDIDGVLMVVVRDEEGEDHVIRNITQDEFRLEPLGSGYWGLTVSSAFK